MNQQVKAYLVIIASIIAIALLGVAILSGQKVNVHIVTDGNGSASSSVNDSESENASQSGFVPSETEANNTPASTEPASTQVTEEVKTTQATANNSIAVSTTAPAVTQPQSGNSMSIEQIVSLYNESANKIKSTAKVITRNYNHISIPEDTLELPSAIQGIGKTAIGTFVKPDDTPAVWTTADDFKLGFPVGGEDYTSHMTADMVQSAVCKDNGNTYQIEIKLKDDAITNPKKGEGYAGVFNTTTASTFEGISIPTVTFNEVKINGINGSIKCTLDKTSKRITAITFSNTDIMYLDVKVVFASLTAKMNMVQESNFTIEY